MRISWEYGGIGILLPNLSQHIYNGGMGSGRMVTCRFVCRFVTILRRADGNLPIWDDLASRQIPLPTAF